MCATPTDIHAAPGSQSGNQDTAPPDNTGNIYWDKYAANPAQTADSIELYAQRYANEPALLGFCLLNEPGHQTSSGNINIGTIQAYYQVCVVCRVCRVVLRCRVCD